MVWYMVDNLLTSSTSPTSPLPPTSPLHFPCILENNHGFIVLFTAYGVGTQLNNWGQKEGRGGQGGQGIHKGNWDMRIFSSTIQREYTITIGE